jgi:hypothetical protein
MPSITINQKVENLERKSNNILIHITSHRFPIDLFPDTLNIEESRLTIITREFPFSSQVHSVDIKDISNVFIDFSPFFAHLTIISHTFLQNEIKISNLKRDEAIHARRIIEGLRTFHEKNIDTQGYSTSELIEKLENLSSTKIEN